MTSEPFPEVIDSSMISAWRSCRHKFFRTYIQHWKASQGSVHLVAGGAFASGVEAARIAFYNEGLSSEEAQGRGLAALWKHYGNYQEPEDSPKGPLRMAGALEFYFDRYPLGADGAVPRRFGPTQGIEFSFLEALPITHPVSGDPLLFSGRADMLAERFGGLYIYDEKTASQLGPTWSSKWDMRSQFTAYCWGYRGFNIKPDGIIIRGVSILKDSYDTQEAVTYRSGWEIDRWLEGVVGDLEEMITAWRKGEWRHNLDDSCLAYGGCPFLRPCKSNDPEPWLNMYFHKRRWDPVQRKEHEV